MLVTEPGIVTRARLEQDLKASWPMLVVPGGIATAPSESGRIQQPASQPGAKQTEASTWASTIHHGDHPVHGHVAAGGGGGAGGD